MKKYKHAPPERIKTFELAHSSEAWNQLNKEMRQESVTEHKRKSEEGQTPEAKERREAAKIQRMTRQLLIEKELHKDRTDCYYDGDDRVHPINGGNWRMLVKRGAVSEKKARQMVRNPDLYPDLCLIYSFWDNRWRVSWKRVDGGE